MDERRLDQVRTEATTHQGLAGGTTHQSAASDEKQPQLVKDMSVQSHKSMRPPSHPTSNLRRNSNSNATTTTQIIQRRHLSMEDAENDNYWSTSLYSKPPVLTSLRCVDALRTFFSTPGLLAVATESSSHPTGLQSVLSQPWIYAGGGLGNIEECPLQVCLAGAGTRRDSITFASVCVPFECHAQDLAADDFPASLELAAQTVLELENNAEDDDDPFEYQTHPEREHHHTTPNDNDWFHTPPEEQRSWAIEYITLQTRIAKLNHFLQTGWTCGNYQVPFEPFPFGVPYLVICAGFIVLTLWSTCRSRDSNKQQPASPRQSTKTKSNEVATTVLIDTEPIFPPCAHMKSSTTSLQTPSYPTQDTQSLASLSSDSPSEPSPLSTPNHTTAIENPTTSLHVATSNEHKHNNPARVAPPKAPTTIMECWDASYHWHKLCTSRHEATACLDGLRVWSILWVILGHVMAIESSTGGGYSNPIDFLPPTGMTTTFLGQLIFASRFAVDTFLIISGYLLVVVMARKAPTLLLGRSKVGTYFHLIGLRLLRILPLYLLCLGFFTQVAPHLYLVGADNEGGGPFWYQWDSLLQPCRDYGWTNLLFINNFIPWEKSNTETCFYHSWYLAVDMQLFVFVGLPVTFFIFLRNPAWGKRTTLALWWTSVLLTAYLSYARHWSVNTFDGVQVGRFDVEGYAKPHVRGQAYFAGMYVAMLQLTKTRASSSEPRTWKHGVLLWGSIVALGAVTFCTVTGAYARRPCQYGEAPIMSDCGSLWSPTTTFLYTASSRAIWSCSIAILMTLCLEGKGGWLNRCLSWPIWAPLAQLSFGTYLIHPIVIFVWLLGMRQKNVYSLATFGMSLTSVCVVSFAWALVAALLVEFPVATLVANQIKKHAHLRRSSLSPYVANASLSETSAADDAGRTQERTQLMCGLRPVSGNDHGYGSVAKNQR